MQCSVIPLTNTFLPRVNGIQVQGTCDLENGDKIYIGGRTLLFKSHGSRQQSTTMDIPDCKERSIEYGRLIQLKRTGEEGVVIKILGEILIGR